MKKRHVILLYGATGDLAIKKILPALSLIISNQDFSKDFAILALGRRDFDTLKYLEYAKKINSSIDIDILSKYLGYVNIDVSNLHDYYYLKNIIKDLSDFKTKVIHFLAIAPSLVLQVAKNLSESEIVTKQSRSHRIIVEKPFGFNLKTAKNLKKQLWKHFDEQQIYRMDHYLGKEAIMEIFDVKFQNKISSVIFKEKQIKEINVFAFEKDGILKRGEYYDKAGAVRDLIQSHLLQIVSLILMDEPKCNACEDLINAKISALKKVFLPKTCCLFGQYEGYKIEKNVSRKTKTETFSFVTLKSKSKKYKNVAINIITGKKMNEKKSGIIVEFTSGEKIQFDLNKNKIIVTQNKKDKTIFEKADFSPYAKLIMQAFESDKRYFVRFDEIETAWKIVDKIEKTKKEVFVYKTNDDIKSQLKSVNVEVFDDLL